MVLALRLSGRIVTVIDTLSHASHQVGLGDFSIRIPVAEQDQLGLLVTSFNTMITHLRELREQEKQRIICSRSEFSINPAPRRATLAPAAKFWLETELAANLSWMESRSE